ncbi:hypothetical protein CJP74_06440 [Psittacicella melopsittaci]|uniref:Uncharacterized protein n=1 Tax=Psittacicella melopsittaci TaxID=2028576 RepID=A0A3A1Y371_9GAMM|nr:hypothetical protein [Psittacicella melopsittaci]RIY31749.1 hypothetical protein CJP74_06440 [Psittacicella melopsittaci]
MFEDKSLFKSLTQLNEKLEAKLKEQKLVIANLEQQVKHYRQELENHEQKHKAELEKLNQQNENNKSFVEENNKLEQQVNTLTTSLNSKIQESEQAQEKFNQLSYSLGVLFTQLNQAIQNEDFERIKLILSGFENEANGNDLLEKYKYYYQDLQKSAVKENSEKVQEKVLEEESVNRTSSTDQSDLLKESSCPQINLNKLESTQPKVTEEEKSESAQPKVTEEAKNETAQSSSNSNSEFSGSGGISGGMIGFYLLAVLLICFLMGVIFTNDDYYW